MLRRLGEGGEGSEAAEQRLDRFWAQAVCPNSPSQTLPMEPCPQSAVRATHGLTYDAMVRVCMGWCADGQHGAGGDARVARRCIAVAEAGGGGPGAGRGQPAGAVPHALSACTQLQHHSRRPHPLPLPRTYYTPSAHSPLPLQEASLPTHSRSNGEADVHSEHSLAPTRGWQRAGFVQHLDARLVGCLRLWLTLTRRTYSVVWIRNDAAAARIGS